MSTKETLKRFKETVDFYLVQLHGFSMEQLARKPSEDEWSLGQVYVHLIDSTLLRQLKNIELCRTPAGDTAAQGQGKTPAGEQVFMGGGFPPIKIQVPPSPEYTPAQPASKEELFQGLSSAVQKMEEVEPTLEEIPPDHTVSHQRLGAMNAKEWFELVEMHYRHHLLQMDRLKQFLLSYN